MEGSCPPLKAVKCVCRSSLPRLRDAQPQGKITAALGVSVAYENLVPQSSLERVNHDSRQRRRRPQSPSFRRATVMGHAGSRHWAQRVAALAHSTHEHVRIRADQVGMPKTARYFVALVGSILVLVTVATAPGNAAPAGALTHNAGLDHDVLTTLNQIRAAHGLVPLRPDAQLTAAADDHSTEMAVDGYFAHPSADGTVFWRRIQHRYPTRGAKLWSVGENLLWSSGALNASTAFQLWMASPEHRANILDPNWRRVGIASVHATLAPGTYDGLDVTIVTTDFGVRR